MLKTSSSEDYILDLASYGLDTYRQDCKYTSFTLVNTGTDTSVLQLKNPNCVDYDSVDCRTILIANKPGIHPFLFEASF